jgi:hypothetical protein
MRYILEKQCDHRVDLPESAMSVLGPVVGVDDITMQHIQVNYNCYNTIRPITER